MASSEHDQHIPIEDLSAYADGEFLSSAEREVIEHHLARCEECRAELDSLQAVSQLLAELPEPDAPRSFRLNPEDLRPVAPADESPIQPWILRHQGLFRYAGLAAALLLVVLVTLDLTRDEPDETGEIFTTMQDVDEEAPEDADEPGIMMTDDADADAALDAPEEEAIEEAAPEEEAADEAAVEDTPDIEADAEEHPAVDPDTEVSDHPAAETEPAPEDEDPEIATRTAAEAPEDGLSMLQIAAIVAGFVAATLLMLGFVIPTLWAASERSRHDPGRQ